MAEIEIERIKNRLLDEFRRYEINLELVLALKFLIENNEITLELIPPERKIKIRDSNRTRTPDLIIRDNQDNYVLNEIKTSISPDANRLEQIIDYLNAESILDQNGNSLNVDDFSLNCIINIESYIDAKEFFQDSISQDVLSKLSITSFIIQESLPRNGMRFYLFELRFNTTIFEELNQLLTSFQKIFSIDIQKAGEELYFLKDPYVQYIITILWTIIIPSVRVGDLFNLSDVEDIIRNYYGRWDENFVFFKREWLRNAIRQLCEMQWIREVNDDDYRILRTLDLSGDIREIVCKKLARLEYERGRPGVDQEGARQVKIDEFFDINEDANNS